VLTTFTVASNVFIGGGKERAEYHPVVACPVLARRSRLRGRLRRFLRRVGTSSFRTIDAVVVAVEIIAILLAIGIKRPWLIEDLLVSRDGRSD
jgi:hypothetical protein